MRYWQGLVIGYHTHKQSVASTGGIDAVVPSIYKCKIPGSRISTGSNRPYNHITGHLVVITGYG